MNAEIELKRLRHLIVLAEELNFTRAAERCNLSQTAFSRSIQALEAGFGVQVFDRGTRSVHITAVGRQLVLRARQLLVQANDLANAIDGIAQADGGELSFGASLMAIDGVLPGVLPALRKQSPGLKVNIVVGQWQLLQQHLEQERIEFFVSYPGPLERQSEFRVTPLQPQPASIFCRSGHPLASRGHPPSPRDVADFPWATVQMPEDLGVQLRRLFGIAPLAPLPVTLSCDNQPLLREAMLSSDTLLFTWSVWLRSDVQEGTVTDLGRRLRPVLPRDMMQLECAVVRLAGRTTSPGAQRLIGLITKGASISG